MVGKSIYLASSHMYAQQVIHYIKCNNPKINQLDNTSCLLGTVSS